MLQLFFYEVDFSFRVWLHEGITKRFPAFVGWETYAFRISSLGLHQAGHDIFERRTKAVECVAYGEYDMQANGICADANGLFSGLGVRIIDNIVEVTVGVVGEQLLRLVNVSVGPIDL